jgi:hypothetical protein
MQQYAATGRYDLPTDEDRHRLLSGYYRQITAANLPDGVGKMKQFACWFTHGVGNGTELRRIVHAARTPSEVLDSVEHFFAQRAADHQVVSRADGLSPSSVASDSMLAGAVGRSGAASEVGRSANADGVGRSANAGQVDRAAATREVDGPAVIVTAERAAANGIGERCAVQRNEATSHGSAQLALEAEVGT